MQYLSNVPLWLRTQNGFESVVSTETNEQEILSSWDSGGQLINVTFADGQSRRVAATDLYLRDKVFGHRDNTNLTYLNAANLLENTLRRYEESIAIPERQGGIYTFTGWLLIAINPYRPIPSLYNEERLNLFPGKPISVVDPHPFAIAEAAYNAMLKQWESQSIVISGESGSGKTECSKHVLKYLAFISDRRHDAKNQGIEHRVLQTNPILEAFGNAKTVRNNNSSRFGKLMKLHFDRKGRMVGASIKTYLLAKSRVCHVPSGERNYHVFYWLCRGALTKERELLGLRTPEQYRYLESGCETETQTQMQELRNALDSVGITRTTQRHVFRVLSAILCLGNLTFKSGERKSDGAKNVTVLSMDIPDKDFKENEMFKAPTSSHSVVNEVDLICNLLGLYTKDSRSQFELVLTSKKIRDVRCDLTQIQARQTADALARSLYQLVFDYIVRRINTSLLRQWHSTTKEDDTPRRISPPVTNKSEQMGEMASLSRHSVQTLRLLPMKQNKRPPIIPQSNPYHPSPISTLPSTCTTTTTTVDQHIPSTTTTEVPRTTNNRYIGVLDIFGFEDLCPYSTNNFEQLCINYANERIHNFFLQQLIGRDRNLYINEGLKPPDIIVQGNDNVCLAIAGTKNQPGIFEFLNEASLVPVVGSKDEYFCQKVNTKLSTSGIQPLPKSKGQSIGKEFIIRHFASEVIYTAAGFTDTNVDVVSNDLKEFLINSCEPFIAHDLCAPFFNEFHNNNISKKESCHLCGGNVGGSQQQSVVNSSRNLENYLANDRKTIQSTISALERNSSRTSLILHSKDLARVSHPPLLGSSSKCFACGAMAGSSSSFSSIAITPADSSSILPFESEESEDDDDSLELYAMESKMEEALANLQNNPLPPHSQIRQGRFRAECDRNVRSNTRSQSARFRGKSNRRQLEQKAKSLASLFSVQVEGLMATLRKTSSFFIRCIKPNDNQKSNLIDKERILRQLETGGMMGVLELMTKGYPCRIPFHDLWTKYKNLLPSTMSSQITPKDLTEIILMYIKTAKDNYRIGHTKAFFRFGALEQLEQFSSTSDDREKEKLAKETFRFWLKKRQERGFAAVRCCSVIWLKIKKERARRLALSVVTYYRLVYTVRKQQRAATRIQRVWRGFLCRRRIEENSRRAEAAIKIQTFWRARQARKVFLRTTDSVSFLQSYVKAVHAKRNFKKCCGAAFLLQPAAHAMIEQSRFLDVYNRCQIAACIIQRWWRKSARESYKNYNTYEEPYEKGNDSPDLSLRCISRGKRDRSLLGLDDCQNQETSSIKRNRRSHASCVQNTCPKIVERHLATVEIQDGAVGCHTPRFPCSPEKSVPNDSIGRFSVIGDRSSPSTRKKNAPSARTPCDLAFYTPREPPTEFHQIESMSTNESIVSTDHGTKLSLSDSKRTNFGQSMPQSQSELDQQLFRKLLLAARDLQSHSTDDLDARDESNLDEIATRLIRQIPNLPPDVKNALLKEQIGCRSAPESIHRQHPFDKPRIRRCTSSQLQYESEKIKSLPQSPSAEGMISLPPQQENRHQVYEPEITSSRFSEIYYPRSDSVDLRIRKVVAEMLEEYGLTKREKKIDPQGRIKKSTQSSGIGPSQQDGHKCDIFETLLECTTKEDNHAAELVSTPIVVGPNGRRLSGLCWGSDAKEFDGNPKSAKGGWIQDDEGENCETETEALSPLLRLKKQKRLSIMLCDQDEHHLGEEYEALSSSGCYNVVCRSGEGSLRPKSRRSFSLRPPHTSERSHNRKDSSEYHQPSSLGELLHNHSLDGQGTTPSASLASSHTSSRIGKGVAKRSLSRIPRPSRTSTRSRRKDLMMYHDECSLTCDSGRGSSVRMSETSQGGGKLFKQTCSFPPLPPPRTFPNNTRSSVSLSSVSSSSCVKISSPHQRSVPPPSLLPQKKKSIQKTVKHKIWSTTDDDPHHQ